ncbi:hypothetical protein E2562_026528 [Oryza meyeriana var. granulata]|uniref:Uncharacterized protein n=1 Tax=Oryza meyeriana var. granulata TaxID=110450 RepID=A0A6G1DP26_9ORYZ|nr:hypothetical protein E2562_026528 [Oryza meyeriana var. granulata]
METAQVVKHGEDRCDAPMPDLGTGTQELRAPLDQPRPSLNGVAGSREKPWGGRPADHVRKLEPWLTGGGVESARINHAYVQQARTYVHVCGG